MYLVPYKFGRVFILFTPSNCDHDCNGAITKFKMGSVPMREIYDEHILCTTPRYNFYFLLPGNKMVYFLKVIFGFNKKCDKFSMHTSTTSSVKVVFFLFFFLNFILYSTKHSEIIGP